MLKGNLVSICLLTNLVVRLAVHPSATEQARPFSFLFAHHFSTADTIIDKSMLRRLTVANLPSVNQKFVEITSNNFLALGASTHILALLIRLSSYSFCLSLISFYRANSVYEVLDECFVLFY